MLQLDTEQWVEGFASQKNTVSAGKGSVNLAVFRLYIGNRSRWEGTLVAAMSYRKGMAVFVGFVGWKQ